MEDKRIEAIKDMLYKRYISSNQYCADICVNAANAYALLCMAQNGASDIVIKDIKDSGEK